jgi:elongation factor P
MIRGGDIGKGTILLIKNLPYLVVEREFVNPGKGTAFARVKMKNLKDGTVLTQTIKTPDMVEDAIVEERRCQYQYSDDDNHVFMDSETFEQVEVPGSLNETLKFYLKEGDVYPILIFEGNAIDVKVPQKVVFTVTDGGNYVKGDTASGATMPVVTETGLTVRVPLFIKVGQKILVNTETNEYVERVND